MTEQLKDARGLPVYEECNYIRIPQENAEEVINLLKDKLVPHELFKSSSIPFFQDEAEFRLRMFIDKDYTNFKNDDREKEIKELALSIRSDYGIFLNDLHIDNGNLLNNDEIDLMIEPWFCSDYTDEDYTEEDDQMDTFCKDCDTGIELENDEDEADYPLTENTVEDSEEEIIEDEEEEE